MFPPGFNHVVWPFLKDLLIAVNDFSVAVYFFLWLYESFSSRKADSTHASSFLPHRWALPSPWPTSQASPLCSSARGRPTMTCAASTPAPWSAPWWRLKWLHVPLFIHRRNKANNTFCHAAVRCSSPANLRISSSCPALSNLHQMRNSCHAQDFILSVKDKRALWKTQIILQQRQRGLPLHHFLTVWAYIQKVPQISPSFETNEVASKWHFRMDWGCKCHQFTGLNSKEKSPTWHFVSQFSLLHVNEVRSWWLAECDISAAACAWGKLSDHSAYLSPVFLVNTFTTRVVLSIKSTVAVQVRNPLVLRSSLNSTVCILHLFSSGHEHWHLLNYVTGPCQKWWGEGVM